MGNKRLKTNMSYLRNHVDYDWVVSKMKDNSGATCYIYPNNLAQIDYIWGKPKIVILYYNIILYCRYWKRELINFWKKLTNI